ncbi:VanZ family protein [Verrucomicrobiaceae bacterium 227]
MIPLKQSARFWGVCFVLWFILLNLLSHGDKFHPPGGFMFDIPHFDKVVHFGYFFGGGGLFSAALYFRRKLSWGKLILTVTVLLSLIGVMDEFHQSFFANRTGNDPGDWLADTLGAFCGALVFRKLHHLLK